MLVAGPPPTPDEGGDEDRLVRREMLANTAAALELPWPRCVRKKSGAGRPTLDAQYENACTISCRLTSLPRWQAKTWAICQAHTDPNGGVLP